MSATFACPHCGASYPIKPVLVGRAVRCTTCKKPFQLRADGIADKVGDPPAMAAPPAPIPAPSIQVIRPIAPPERPTPADAATVVTPTPPSERVPTASLTRGPRTERLSKQQEDARKAMAATLSHAASAALSAETIKREGEAVKRAERKKSAAKPGSATGEGRVGDIGPVVLTGTGVREHRNNLLWMLGAIGVVGALCAVVFLFSLKTPQSAALTHFAAVVEGDRSRYPERILAIQERAWVVGVAPLTSLGRIRIGATRTIPFLTAREIITRLKGMTYLAETNLWVAPQRAANVDKLWNVRKDRAANLALLAERKVAVIDQRTVATDLQAVGWSADDVDLFLELIQARTDRTGANWIASKLLAGELPDAIEIAPFTGSKGTLLTDVGRAYKHSELAYSGRLLHFVGAGWPNEWKVLEVKTTSAN